MCTDRLYFCNNKRWLAKTVIKVPFVDQYKEELLHHPFLLIHSLFFSAMATFFLLYMLLVFVFINISSIISGACVTPIFPRFIYRENLM